MSTIFLKKKNYKSRNNILDKSNKDKIFNKYDDVIHITKENLPSQKEWFNSIYSYNKNYLNYYNKNNYDKYKL